MEVRSEGNGMRKIADNVYKKYIFVEFCHAGKERNETSCWREI